MLAEIPFPPLSQKREIRPSINSNLELLIVNRSLYNGYQRATLKGVRLHSLSEESYALYHRYGPEHFP
jgi:hypothetical protein